MVAVAWVTSRACEAGEGADADSDGEADEGMAADAGCDGAGGGGDADEDVQDDQSEDSDFEADSYSEGVLDLESDEVESDDLASEDLQPLADNNAVDDGETAREAEETDTGSVKQETLAIVASGDGTDDETPTLRLGDGFSSSQEVSSDGAQSPPKDGRVSPIPHTPTLFQSPMCGNSGPPDNEVQEFCWMLMKSLGEESPEIVGSLHSHFNMFENILHAC